MYFNNSNDRRNKTMADMERQQERLVRTYNSVFNAISNMKTAKEYLATRNLPYQLLRRIIVEENKIPYVKISNKYYVNYNHVLRYMDELS